MKDAADKKPSRPFEAALRQKLDEVDGTPRKAVWDRLEADLDQEKPARRPLGIIAFRSMLLVALLLLILTGGMLILRQQMPSQPASAVETPRAVTTGSEPNTQGAGTQTAEPAQHPAAASVPGKQPDPAATGAGAAESNTPSLAQNALSGGYPTTSKPAKSTEAPAEARQDQLQQANKPGRAGRKSKAGAGIAAIASAPASSPGTALAERKRTRSFRRRGTKSPDGPAEVQSAQGGETMITSSPAAAQKAPEKQAAAGAAADSASATKAASLAHSSALSADTAAPFAPDSAATAVALPLILKADSAAAVTDSAALPGKTVAKPKSAYSIGFSAGALYFHQNIRLLESSLITPNSMSPLGVDPLFESAAGELQNKTFSSFSYRGNLLVGRELTEWLRLETGLSYSRLTAVTTSRYLIADTTRAGSSTVYHSWRPFVVGVLSPWQSMQKGVITEAEEHRVRQEYEYVHLPVRLQLLAAAGRWHYFGSAGLEAARLLRNRITSDHPFVQASGLTRNYMPVFRPWLWSGLLAAGAGYRLSDRLTITGSGELSVGLTPLTKAKEIQGVRQRGPRVLSVSAGLTYTLSGK